MTRTNLLFLLSDEHRRDALGCYGHPFVKTPNLDRLAARGTRFTQAYCNSPLCVPSRASLATGRYVHETRCWDNGHPFEGQLPSWAERLRDQGHRTVAVGKLHYRRSEDANGFSEEIIPLHLIDGTGDLIGLLRKEGAHYGATERYAKDAGPGESDYTDYDRRIAAAAVDWLRSEAPRHRDKPWALFVSFVSPHFPLTAPREFYDLYAAVRMPRPRAYGDDERHRHPFLEGLTRAWNYDDYFDEERLQVARSAYFGLCSFLDHNIGTVLAALEDAGLMDDTRVLYSSDHGEMLGDQGIWSTSVMYEASAGVPLLLAGPGVPKNREIATITSLVDVFPTVIECTGAEPNTEDAALPGHSLIHIAKGARPERTVLTEYHAGGSITGCFMVRVGRWKYVHYVGLPPQLFDMEADPDEIHDLGRSPDHAGVLQDCEAKLRRVVDPEAANNRAFADQAATIERHGGVEAILERGDYGYTPAPGGKPCIRG